MSARPHEILNLRISDIETFISAKKEKVTQKQELQEVRQDQELFTLLIHYLTYENGYMVPSSSICES